MNRKYHWAVLLFFALSCGKILDVNSHPEMIGRWGATDVVNSNYEELTFKEDGHAEYLSNGYTRKAKARINAHHIWISDHRFRIISLPQTDTSFHTTDTSFENPPVMMELETPAVDGRHDLKFYKYKH
ncbi:MAG TPA: hypothetical protein VL651_12130 [Bacteroidia bacterium]|jgi:hypothetical protein|nr:hypothetical protein [Bacteroidia bacterium]